MLTKEAIKSRAIEIGFADAGITSAEPLLRNWILLV
jgi:hypothetical protein